MSSRLLQAIQESGVNEKATEQVLTTGDYNLWPAFLNMIVVLGVAVIVLIFVIWLIKKLGGNQFALSNPDAMKLVNTLQLGDRKFVTVLKVGERHILLGVTNNSINTLAELTEDDIKKLPTQGSDSGGQSFAEILKKLGFSGKDKHETE